MYSIFSTNFLPKYCAMVVVYFYCTTTPLECAWRSFMLFFLSPNRVGGSPHKHTISRNERKTIILFAADIPRIVAPIWLAGGIWQTKPTTTTTTSKGVQIWLQFIYCFFRTDKIAANYGWRFLLCVVYRNANWWPFSGHRSTLARFDRSMLTTNWLI